MMSIKSGAIVAMAVAAMSGTSARAVELITNGDFDSGSLAGWTQSPSLTWLPVLAGTTMDTQIGTAPLSLSYDLLNAISGPDGTQYSLYQDVTIPAGYNAALTTNHRITYIAFDDATTVDRLFAISVQDLTNSLPAAPLLVQNIVAGTADPQNPQAVNLGWAQNTYNLSGYAGLTVRIRFQAQVMGSDMVLSSLELDNISLNATTIPEPASWALGALAAIPFIRRSRR